MASWCRFSNSTSSYRKNAPFEERSSFLRLARRRLPFAGHVASNAVMIRKLKSGEFRIYSRHADKKTGKRKNLGTFSSREAAEKHERAIQFFKHH